MSAHGWTPKKKPNGDARQLALGVPRSRLERERAYAHAALDGCADEVAEAASGERNDTLNKKAFRLGTMVARGWVSSAEVFDALFAAASACGLSDDDGEEATRKTLKSGLDDGKKFPHPDLPQTFRNEAPSSNSWKYHTGEAPAPPPWLIKGILPRNRRRYHVGPVGDVQNNRRARPVCLRDGAVCRSLAGISVKRPGAVLYLALEGAGMLLARLSAIAAHRGVTGPLPFAWRDDCPALTDKNAADALCAIARRSGRRSQAQV